MSVSDSKFRRLLSSPGKTIADEIKEFLSVQPFEADFIKWCEKNVDFSGDVSSASNKFSLDGREYQREPLEQIGRLDGRRKITVCFPEQMGKTNLFILGLLYRAVFLKGEFLIVYPRIGFGERYE